VRQSGEAMKMKSAVSVLLVFALVCINSGCHTTRTVKSHIPKNPGDLMIEKIVGVTTVKGEEISFDEPGGRLVQKAIEAKVNKESRSFPLSDIQHVWLVKQKLTTGAKVAIVSGVAIAAIVAVTAIALAQTRPSSNSSCPFIYSWDGSQFVLDGEPYGGAIARGLAREDWSELKHIRDVNGEYRVLMTNEADETQHTDLAELWVADHPAGVRVVANENGKLIGLSNIQPPVNAQDKIGRDITQWLVAKDRRIWEPEPAPDADGSLQNQIVLTFPKPADASEAWLVSNTATGTWGSLMIKQMVSLLGRDANRWLDSLGNSRRVASVYRWAEREETLRLKVDVEESSGWRTGGALFGGGPIVAEDRALPLDVRRVPGNRLRIRLRPPVGFWALNSFGISYNSAGPVPFTRLAAQSALTSDGIDVAKQLASKEGVYYSMPEIGNAAGLLFKAPPRQSAMERTVFLHTAGWYQLHFEAGGDPDQRAFNEVLNTPGSTARFTASQYEAWKHANR